MRSTVFLLGCIAALTGCDRSKEQQSAAGRWDSGFAERNILLLECTGLEQFSRPPIETSRFLTIDLKREVFCDGDCTIQPSGPLHRLALINHDLIDTGSFHNCTVGQCAATWGGSYKISRESGTSSFVRRGAGVVDTTHYYVGKCAIIQSGK